MARTPFYTSQLKTRLTPDHLQQLSTFAEGKRMKLATWSRQTLLAAAGIDEPVSSATDPDDEDGDDTAPAASASARTTRRISLRAKTRGNGAAHARTSARGKAAKAKAKGKARRAARV